MFNLHVSTPVKSEFKILHIDRDLMEVHNARLKSIVIYGSTATHGEYSSE